MDVPNRSKRLAAVGLLWLAFAVVCGLPYRRWSAHPSLFDDDFGRVGNVRRYPLRESLFRPFNEHLAPLFEVVTWVAWQGSGRRIEAVASAFQVASFAAFGLTVGLLGLLIRRETGSTPAAMAGLAAFALSTLAAETVLWYSASSFQWSAAMTVAAWLCAAEWARGGRIGWLAASAMAAMAGPAFSAVGVLAGPIAAVRLGVNGRGKGRWGASVAPMAGTLAFLAVGSLFRYRDVVAASVGRNLEPSASLWASIRAPGMALVPGLIGLSTRSSLPEVVAAALGVAGLVGGLIWARSSRDRPLILGGLAMIAGGYVATYATRARAGDAWIFEVGRYHLFPQIGLACLVGAGFARASRRFERRPVAGLAAATLFAMTLAVGQHPRMARYGLDHFRYPDQARAITAAARLEGVCEAEGITLIQAIHALDPIRRRWAPQDWPFHMLLCLFDTGPQVARLPDPAVRPRLLAALSVEDREAFFGGLDATRYRSASAPDAAGWPAHLVAITKEGFLEYRAGPEADEARWLDPPRLRGGGMAELWWTDDVEGWTPARSVRWRPEGEGGILLDALPHWRRGFARRLRVIVREGGTAVIGWPTFRR